MWMYSFQQFDLTGRVAVVAVMRAARLTPVHRRLLTVHQSSLRWCQSSGWQMAHRLVHHRLRQRRSHLPRRRPPREAVLLQLWWTCCRRRHWWRKRRRNSNAAKVGSATVTRTSSDLCSTWPITVSTGSCVGHATSPTSPTSRYVAGSQIAGCVLQFVVKLKFYNKQIYSLFICRQISHNVWLQSLLMCPTDWWSDPAAAKLLGRAALHQRMLEVDRVAQSHPARLQLCRRSRPGDRNGRRTDRSTTHRVHRDVERLQSRRVWTCCHEDAISPISWWIFHNLLVDSLMISGDSGVFFIRFQSLH